MTILDTEEMWDKYLTTILKLLFDMPETVMYKRSLLRESMLNAHKKKKLKPIHYIKWVKYFKLFPIVYDNYINFFY